MSTVSLRIGGVPEHFNFPWRLAHSIFGFSPNGVDFTWKDYYGGTGFMREDLHAGNLDLAVMLTEGAIADINKNPGLKIVGQYVSSPLHWGVHVHAEDGPLDTHTLINTPFAISRKGSGSHLMAYVYAQQQGWNPEELRFVEVKNLEGARKSLAEGTATAFLWEKFTTKPVVDSGEWRRIDVVLTPWPSFVVVGREEVVNQQGVAIQKLLEQIKVYLTKTTKPQIISLINQDLGLDETDVEIWLAQTRWDCLPQISSETLSITESTLAAVGLVNQRLDPKAYIAPYTQLV
ncbi:MAG TPA: ABC transporter substrate-binding protein [Cytophagales bacterium]|nr:ABC transporter substrate-binding protein [Cytophagales bacterium]HAA18373.1 ABC transporter substrate-binding protein [Cytophagales bacterium]HAP61420.1 ABC transporter substrate-binding protein [Cytophagales bacterium]